MQQASSLQSYQQYLVEPFRAQQPNGTPTTEQTCPRLGLGLGIEFQVRMVAGVPIKTLCQQTSITLFMVWNIDILIRQYRHKPTCSSYILIILKKAHLFGGRAVLYHFYHHACHPTNVRHDLQRRSLKKILKAEDDGNKGNLFMRSGYTFDVCFPLGLMIYNTPYTCCCHCFLLRLHLSSSGKKICPNGVAHDAAHERGAQQRSRQLLHISSTSIVVSLHSFTSWFRPRRLHPPKHQFSSERCLSSTS